MEVDDYIAISALQHYIFCPRQAALIHIDREWRDDVATTIGNQLHERVDKAGADSRTASKVIRALPIVCHRLRIAGVADMVEFASATERPIPIPVEVKKGKKKSKLADEVQLCAQALCLEEMFACEISTGYVFHAESHRRREVVIGPALRVATINAIEGMQRLFASQQLPLHVADERVCKACSLEPLCLPNSIRRNQSATTYLRRLANQENDK